MNEEIVQILSDEIHQKGITIKFISDKTGIGYQRLMRILNQNANITGNELLKIGKLLDLDLNDLQNRILAKEPVTV